MKPEYAAQVLATIGNRIEYEYQPPISMMGANRRDEELSAIEAGIAALKVEGTRLPEAVKKMLDATCSALIVEAGATEAPFVAMIQCEQIYAEGDTAEAAIDALAAQLTKQEEGK